jgi:hypothetical protein
MPIPYGIHMEYMHSMRELNIFHERAKHIPHGIHMESMEYIHSIWIPYGFHGIYPFHMDSIWIPYGMWGHGKVLKTPTKFTEASAPVIAKAEFRVETPHKCELWSSCLPQEG